MDRRTFPQHERAIGGRNGKAEGIGCRLDIVGKRMLERILIAIRRLTHRGNVLHDTDELIQDSLASDVALIDGITASDGMESKIWPRLVGVSLQLRQGPC